MCAVLRRPELLPLAVICLLLVIAPCLGDERGIFPSEQDDADDPELHFKDSEQVPPMLSWQIRRLHKKMDLNEDSKVTMAELKRFSQAIRRELVKEELDGVFGHYDKDKDGSVSLEEALAFESRTHEHEPPEVNKRRVDFEKAKFHASDSDNDGLLDMQEIVSWLYPETDDKVIQVHCAEKMREKDKNGDEALSPQEFWLSDMPESEMGNLPALGEREESDFRELDQDGDGLLNVMELEAYEGGHMHEDKAISLFFKLADKDLDGALTFSEMDLARVDIITTEVHWYMHQWEKGLPPATHEEEL